VLVRVGTTMRGETIANQERAVGVDEVPVAKVRVVEWWLRDYDVEYGLIL
jgi:hypothetical protein